MKKYELEKIVISFEPKIKKFFSRKVFIDNDIDDLVQETLYQAVKSVSSFKEKSQIGTWIYSICNNILHSYVYQKEKYLKIIEKMKIVYSSNSESFTSRIEFQMILDTLSAEHKLLYRLYYEKRYKIEEISLVLKKAEGTIKYLLFQLRCEIRAKIK